MGDGKLGLVDQDFGFSVEFFRFDLMMILGTHLY
jgi:hypothetical protein